MIRFIARLQATIWARSLEFLRDRASLGWNLAMPFLLVAGLAAVFSGPGQPIFKVAVVADARPLDAGLDPFLATPHIQFYRELELERGLTRLQRHRCDLLLDLRGATPVYWVNALSDKGALVERLLQGSAAIHGGQWMRQQAQGDPIRYVDWVLPGILGMNMMWSCLFGVGYVIVRYRKSGYLKRLNATPLGAGEFVLAQLLSRMLLVLLVSAIVFAAAVGLLGLRHEGSTLNLLLMAALGAAAMTSLSLMVAARVSSEELAGGLLNLLSWPMMVLSGVFFSLDGSPRWIQWLADGFPLTHLISAARAVMIDGASLAEVQYHAWVMLGMTVLFVSVGALSFRWTSQR